MPSRPDATNPLTVSNNVHMGLEVRGGVSVAITVLAV